MNYRRILYIAFVMFILIWCWQNLSPDDKREEMATMPQEIVMEQMAAQYDKPDRLILFLRITGNGRRGLYLTVYQGPEFYTDKYRIVNQTRVRPPIGFRGRKLENIQLPINKFQVYSLEDDKWEEQS